MFPSVERPDLDEFLSALNGFLDKQTTPTDPGYLRFLEIFCRSVGSSEGHILKSNPSGSLESVMSYGVGPDFDKDFNRVNQNASGGSPLDEAFSQQKVVAIVELKPGPGTPDWFMKLMNKYEYKSLVAVPLLGHTKPVGILCAYYKDFCLFDQGTLDRLMGIGKMVGTATEKSMVAGLVQSNDAKEKVADDFLQLLTTKGFMKMDVYKYLRTIITKLFAPVSMICGPIHSDSGPLLMTVADGEGIPSSTVTQRVAIPNAVQKKLESGQWPKTPAQLSGSDWGALAPSIQSPNLQMLCRPILWRGQLQGAVLVWRTSGEPFQEADDILFARLVAIASLALNTV